MNVSQEWYLKHWNGHWNDCLLFFASGRLYMIWNDMRLLFVNVRHSIKECSNIDGYCFSIFYSKSIIVGWRNEMVLIFKSTKRLRLEEELVQWIQNHFTFILWLPPKMLDYMWIEYHLCLLTIAPVTADQQISVVFRKIKL